MKNNSTATFFLLLLLLSLQLSLLSSYHLHSHRPLLTTSYHSSSHRLSLFSSSTKTTTSDSAADVLLDDGWMKNEKPPQTQILEFIEPTTKVPVVLVGAMHYNPSSIALTKNTIATLAEENNIASVIVECCPIRWNRTHELIPTNEEEQLIAERNKQDNPLLKKLLYNEMVAANEMAEKYNIPFILGDQLINVTTSRIRQATLDTIKDLLNPIHGWQRLYNDVVSSARVAFPVGPEYLGAGDFFNTQLLLLTPVTLIRYPLALFLKAPVAILPVLGLFLYAFSPANSLSDIFDYDLSIWNRVQGFSTSLVIFFLEIALLSRVFLVSILAERNEFLAKSILEQCQLHAEALQREEESSLSQREVEKKREDLTVFGLNLSQWLIGLFPSSKEGKGELVSGTSSSPPPKKIVAVLGMAHCNGIKQLLLNEQVKSNSD